MIDLKVAQSVLAQLEEERGITREHVLSAIEEALAHAYKKEYGKRGQIVRAHFDLATGGSEFSQVKLVVDGGAVYMDEEADRPEDDAREHFDPEKHILLEDARRIKKDAEVGDELVFPLEPKDDFGRIATQTAKQVLIQKIREAEKTHLTKEFSKREGEIVTGAVQRIERGNLFIDLGRAVGILPYEEQIPGERYRQGERIRGYLYNVEETPRGVFLRISRSHPQFIEKLFEQEAPEVAHGTVEIRAIAREAGSRSKVAAYSNDIHVDPVGSLVGQRGVRVSTVMSELGGEKIDIIEWSDDPEEFIEEALSPAKVLSVEIADEDLRQAVVRVTEDQQSLAIGRGGQNVRLAARLTGWRIDIQSATGEIIGEAEADGPTDKPGEETTQSAIPTSGEVGTPPPVGMGAEANDASLDLARDAHPMTPDSLPVSSDEKETEGADKTKADAHEST